MSEQKEKWTSGLARTRKSAFGRIASFLGTSEISNDSWDELEALLIQADLGVETSLEIVDELKQQSKDSGWIKLDDLKQGLAAALSSRIADIKEINLNPLPNTFSFSSNINRFVSVRRFRIPQTPIFEFDDRKFEWERRYDFN